MKTYIITILLILSNVVFADGSKAQFNNGWIKYLPPVVPMRAGYMEIQNLTNQDIRIISAQSDAFEKVEMHESRLDQGMMKMIQQDFIEILANSSIELAPGGLHLMMITPKDSVEIGDQINLTMTFSDGKTQSINLEVKK